MTVWLGRQEAVARFKAYLDYVAALDLISHSDIHDDNNDDNDENIEEPAAGIPSSQPIRSLAVKPAFPHMDVNALTTRFQANSFIPTLSRYICRAIPPPALPTLPNSVDRFDLYKRITLNLPAASGFSKSVDRLRATPAVPAKGKSKAVPAHFDTVLVRVADANENEHTRGTCLEGA
jgi:hypothetical protein